MADQAEKDTSELLKEILRVAGPYATFALSARRKYAALRTQQEREVRSIFRRLGDETAKEIRSMYRRGYGSSMGERYLEHLGPLIRGKDVSGQLQKSLRGSIEKAVDAGTSYAFDITRMQMGRTRISVEPLERMVFRTNKQAVDAMWARSEHGLMLSDRIWDKGVKSRNAITEIIQNAVATGEDPVHTARALERYVRAGKKTVASDYPEMMNRLGNRIPGDISYEALRLARTETAAAYGEGTILAARATPSYTGMKWVLSSAHPKPDRCDDLAAADYGMGRGVYPPGQEPHMPAHPNCHCILISVHEDLDIFMNRLNQWTKQPESQPDLEEWYHYVYLKVG
ncbi:retron-type reverse transcriptase [Paenibacillus sp. HN-1]|uniref:retron-type reverse transcriptase n=1 Tax=Paenibacillus TaxID=44249 RepID=UPI001CA92F16|nr:MULTISPECIES: retron-type reverse transcriptase [Paenibacillus]MBY9081005.1 retron-type reverse transcriptase [Paenibacillus sp. CGMCC 1.18879]MBY9084107.1 retron-type reverse transcriptase [Paenibacillus sinensis]